MEFRFHLLTNNEVQVPMPHFAYISKIALYLSMPKHLWKERSVPGTT